MNLWLVLGVAWGVMILVMAGVWWLQSRLGDAGIVDVVWTYSVGMLSIVYGMLASEGDVSRRALVGVLAGIWSLRLGTHILIRVMRMPEDGRYIALKEEAGDQAQRKLFVFYQYQAFGAVLFSVPMLIAAVNPAPLGVWDFVGLVVFGLAWGGEALADQQLSAWRGDAANRGRVCRRGLWRYSRHPNYFFEWMHWWAYAALAATAPWGWVALIGPLAMYYFINHVTGIPPTEKQAIKSRGEAYREYQRTTSPFFPWPPQKASS